MKGSTARKKRGKNFSKQKLIFLLKFLFPKNIFLSLLSGLVWAGLFSVVIYTFATPPTSPYTLGETLNPSCAPGSTNCTVTEPAAYSFTSNNFSGTGGFTTTGTVSGGTLTDGTISIISGSITSGVDATFSGTGSFGSLVLTTSALGVGYGGTGVSSIAAGSVLAANTANTLTAINSTSGTKYLQNVDGTISWGEISSGSYVPYTGANANVDLGAYNITTTGLGTLGKLIVDTSTLVANVTGYEDMVGIGTATPSQELDVVGDIELEDTTSDDTGVIYKGANRFLHNFHHPTGSTAVPDGKNTFVGELAGNFTMGSTATNIIHASYNTGVGYEALQANTTGGSNTANGYQTLRSNTSGGYNTANGYRALYANTFGGYNTANGAYTLYFSTSGNYNTANGYSALLSNTTGSNNTANGMSALYSSKTGSNGTAFGYQSQGYANDTAVAWTNYNTSVGYQALMGSTTAANNTGNYNTALGYQSLLNLTTGSHNTAVGYMAGYYIAGGAVNNTTSDYSIYLGNSTKASADDAQNEIVIGYDATGLGSNSVVLGNSSITTTVLRGAVGIGVEAPSQELDVVGDIELEDTTSDDTGVIYKGANRFLHNFHHPTGDTAVPVGQNIFVGELAGNFTMGSTATSTSHASYNVGVGYESMQANTTGYYNTAIGFHSLYANTSGSLNTAVGVSAAQFNTTGWYNISIGIQSFEYNRTGGYNTAIGVYSLRNNWAGSNGTAIGYESQSYVNNTTSAWTNYNTSVGYQALRGSNTAANNTGNYNTALGYQTLYGNTTGANNVANGYQTLYSNTTGENNVANGNQALFLNTVGGSNVAIGGSALRSNSGAFFNVGVGHQALYSNTTGASNTALGYQAGVYISGGAVGNTTSDYSIYLGANTKASADDAQNEIVIGYNATGQGNNTITFGNTSMVGAYFLADDYKTYWGAGKNASINYDGDNMYFNSQEVGSGSFIFSGGNVGIGTVTTPTNAKLVVNGGIAVGADALNNTISTGSLGDGTTTLYVGTYTVDTTAPSDIITKEEIVSTSYGLEDLLKLSVKNYKYKRQYVNEGAVQEEHTGLIAQDVEQIYPEAVIYRSDGLKAINYTKMIPLIISSIQELSAGKTLSDNGTWGEGTVSGLEDSSFTAQLKLAFTSLGIYIEKGVATFEEVIAQKATIKTAKVEGLEMVDKTTGEIWCTQINNGEWTKTKGECNPSVVTQETSTESSAKIETALEVETTVQNESSSEEIMEEVKEKVKEEVKEEVSQQVAEKIKDQVVQEVTEQVAEQITEAVQQVAEQSNEAKHSANEAQQSAKESQKHAEQAQQAVEKSAKQQSESVEESQTQTVEAEPAEAVETVENIETESVEEPVVEQAQEEQQSSVGDLIQDTTAGLFSGVMNFIKWLFGSAAQTVSKAVPVDIKQSTASLSSTFTDNFMEGIRQIINDVKNILKF